MTRSTLAFCLVLTTACSAPASRSDRAGTEAGTEESETAPVEDTEESGETSDPAGSQCQADLQDCPEDYKCLLRLGADDWEFVCLPVTGDQGVGEVCEHDGVIAGTDNCDESSWCIGAFDPNGASWDGLCYSLCVEDQCESGDRCVGVGSLPVCAPICDPLMAGSCAEGELCMFRSPDGFVCFPNGAEDNGVGEPCITPVGCAPGLHCSQNVLGCDSEAYCCTDYCDVDGDEPCARADQGAICEAIGASDPTQAHVGACVSPA